MKRPRRAVRRACEGLGTKQGKFYSVALSLKINWRLSRDNCTFNDATEKSRSIPCMCKKGMVFDSLSSEPVRHDYN